MIFHKFIIIFFLLHETIKLLIYDYFYLPSAIRSLSCPQTLEVKYLPICWRQQFAPFWLVGALSRYLKLTQRTKSILQYQWIGALPARFAAVKR